jgi:hypothetical protein
MGEIGGMEEGTARSMWGCYVLLDEEDKGRDIYSSGSGSLVHAHSLELHRSPQLCRSPASEFSLPIVSYGLPLPLRLPHPPSSSAIPRQQTKLRSTTLCALLQLLLYIQRSLQMELLWHVIGPINERWTAMKRREETYLQLANKKPRLGTHAYNASLAQSVERQTLNLKVAGSTPAWGFLFVSSFFLCCTTFEGINPMK